MDADKNFKMMTFKQENETKYKLQIAALIMQQHKKEEIFQTILLKKRVLPGFLVKIAIKLTTSSSDVLVNTISVISQTRVPLNRKIFNTTRSLIFYLESMR